VRALVVEADPVLRTQLVRALERDGFTVLEARDGSAAMATASLSALDVVVLDLALPDLPALDVLGVIRRRGTHAIVLVAGPEHQEDRDVALSLGAGGAVDKPVEDGEFLDQVHRALLPRVS